MTLIADVQMLALIVLGPEVLHADQRSTGVGVRAVEGAVAMCIGGCCLWCTAAAAVHFKSCMSDSNRSTTKGERTRPSNMSRKAGKVKPPRRTLACLACPTVCDGMNERDSVGVALPHPTQCFLLMARSLLSSPDSRRAYHTRCPTRLRAPESGRGFLSLSCVLCTAAIVESRRTH